MTMAASDAEQRTLAAVLDRIIPARADGSLPGAGGLDLSELVVTKLGETWPETAAGLTALEEMARERGAAGFAELAEDEADAALNALGATHPGFLPGLVFHTYTAYYQDLRVVEQLGVPPRPPYPEGYDLEPGDLGSLQAVRERGRLYREA